MDTVTSDIERVASLASGTQLGEEVTVADGSTKILTGQKALVTGANSGIGKAVAVALGKAGADVVVNYLAGEDRAEAVAEEIRRSGVRALALKADVYDEAQVQEMFRRAVAELGIIDILVTNAGASAGCAVPHHELGAVEHGHRG
jgi:glucose 1-dehydrogenase